MPAMPIKFCLATFGKAVPKGPDWIHEIKYDGIGCALSAMATG
jgi:ATP-dependent DNA ligase